MLRYLYTTMSDEGLESTIESSDFKAPMAGFGYGLPLSRLVSSTTLSFLDFQVHHGPREKAIRLGAY